MIKNECIFILIEFTIKDLLYLATILSRVVESKKCFLTPTPHFFKFSTPI